MQVYVGHSTSFDYTNELYNPLRNSSLWEKCELIFPHDMQDEATDTKKIIMNCDIFIAEVSYPSTGLGIELGWASNAQCGILCLAKEGVKPSSSLKIICSDIITYTSNDSLIKNINNWIEGYCSKKCIS